MTIYLISWNLLMLGKKLSHKGFLSQKVSTSAAVVLQLATFELMKLHPFGLRLEFKGQP